MEIRDYLIKALAVTLHVDHSLAACMQILSDKLDDVAAAKMVLLLTTAPCCTVSLRNASCFSTSNDCSGLLHLCLYETQYCVSHLHSHCDSCLCSTQGHRFWGDHTVAVI